MKHVIKNYIVTCLYQNIKCYVIGNLFQNSHDKIN